MTVKMEKTDSKQKEHGHIETGIHLRWESRSQLRHSEAHECSVPSMSDRSPTLEFYTVVPHLHGWGDETLGTLNSTEGQLWRCGFIFFVGGSGSGGVHGVVG